MEPGPLNALVSSEDRWDTLVIGGGPAGSTAATFLAKAGRRVLVLERERFPRFHIGESLLPYNRGIFEALGVLPQLEAAGFQRKYGAQFHLGNGSTGTAFVFREGCFTREPEAFQVDRATFDTVLLRHAESSGAVVREAWTVRRFDEDSEGVTVEAADDRGRTVRLTADWLIDASGRGNVTGNQEGLRIVHPRHRKVAIFGHFSGVRRDPGPSGGDTVIIRLADAWFWIIPLSPGRTSVGLVVEASRLGGDVRPADLFRASIDRSPPMQERMGDAVSLGALQTTADFSYVNRRLVGRRLLRAGDAAGFMDPIFSAGVYLAMFSGKLAAETLLDCARRPGGRERSLVRYERRVMGAMRFYWRMVEAFYTRPFMELFLQPRHRLQLPGAVNAFLAGELEGNWTIRWRLRLFFLLVRLQRRWPLVPRLTFD
ncbi:MAG: tryptophan 7-halogenase [Verrucomicrobiae bacterium]|nr:tryptophan 7-halogenase [Verrucomicrobiae bacterium]